MRRFLTAIAALAILGMLAGTALASGFLGKGDVQRAMEWNNKELQAKAGTVTGYRSTSVSEYTWECFNPANGKDIGKYHVVSTTYSATAVARDGRNQVTGFILTETGSTTEGEDNVGKCGGHQTLVENSIEGPTPTGLSSAEVEVNGTWHLIP